LSESTDNLFIKPHINLRRGPDGALYLKSNTPLEEIPASVVGHLYKWAEQRSDTVFLAERDPDDPGKWLTITYAQFLQQVLRLAANLRRFDLSAQRPLMLLSGNSIANALMTYAGYLLGVPVVPVSPSYSLLSTTYDKVLYIQELTAAAVVFAQLREPFAGVLDTLEQRGLQVITADSQASSPGDVLFDELLADAAQSDFEPVALAGDTVAKILFTSGSTGMPKGVVNTHAMMSSNQEAMATVWPFIIEPGHVFLDWLPWHHTFGGNHNFNMVLRNGASLYIDSGKPTPDGILETVRNIKDVMPTLAFNVAVGYDLLATQLEQDAEAARCFFKNLRLIFFAAAALPTPTRERLEKLNEQYAQYPVVITSSWGQTETSPAGTTMHFECRTPNCIGVPLPGTEVKLAPVDDLLELCIKGPNVMSEYLKEPTKTAESFDNEGFFRTGDAVEICDPEQPNLGLIFKGRVSENFKLLSGTWVNVNELRLAMLATLAPWCNDAVICGHNQNYVSVLLFPDPVQCRRFTGQTTGDIAGNAGLQAEIAQRLRDFNSENRASSRCVKRALIQSIPPSFEDNEITDKGYLNQRGILANRADQVEMLHCDSPPPEVIVP